MRLFIESLHMRQGHYCFVIIVNSAMVLLIKYLAKVLTFMNLRFAGSIHQRLILIIMATAVFAVCTGVMAVSTMHYLSATEELRDEMEVTAGLVAAQMRSALDFNDPIRAQEVLRRLRTNQTVNQACVYTLDNQLYSAYTRQGVIASCQKNLSLKGIEKLEKLTILYPIKGVALANSEPELRGMILIQGNDNRIADYFQRTFVIGFLAILGVGVMTYIFASYFQRSISKPIYDLSDIAQNVSTFKDYSVRAQKGQMRGLPKEILTLYQSFNSMLSEIEDRDRKLRKKNEELVNSKELAEAANLSKSQFLANISHELRTPLNAIIGFSDILQTQTYGPIGNEKYIEYIRDIHDSGGHLLEIINDILDLSKAEAGKITLDLDEFKPERPIEKCITILSEKALQNNVEIRQNYDERLPYLVADRVRFTQIILNILSNAVKFTDPGGYVEIAMKAQQGNNDISFFTITITDSGIGMSPQDVQQALEPFGQADGGLNRKYEGTGLGLPLTKKLVELHNASIDIKSEVGKGTSVTLRFISDPSLIKV